VLECSRLMKLVFPDFRAPMTTRVKTSSGRYGESSSSSSELSSTNDFRIARSTEVVYICCLYMLFIYLYMLFIYVVYILFNDCLGYSSHADENVCIYHVPEDCFRNQGENGVREFTVSEIAIELEQLYKSKAHEQ
jgi:hypothetical protein